MTDSTTTKTKLLWKMMNMIRKSVFFLDTFFKNGNSSNHFSIQSFPTTASLNLEMLTGFDPFFIGWTHDVMLSVEDNVDDHFKLLGVVEALSSIFKVGSRKLLLSVVTTTWSDISLLMKSATAIRSPLLRKLLVKLSQRVGLTCLPHRSPAWRYMGEIKSLGDVTAQPNGEQTCSTLPDQKAKQHGAVPDMEFLDDEEIEVPEIVEEIIELFLLGLRDSVCD